ncbi:Aldo-ket-red domain-containing protein [Aphelenchoides besseyi]|nr:Aldo-ket-red domain-containing protein [Aphelenchoides besseyi]KAI6223392.1 Aldo-ket-red domain-containing protein [Aphelenchoides besseyi]
MSTLLSLPCFSCLQSRIKAKMSQSQQVKLANGNQMPLIGLGTWLASNPNELKDAVRVALDSGYKHIDTATMYHNEGPIGEVLQEFYDAGKLKRQDIFLTTKLPFEAHDPALAEKVIERSLKNLRTDYIDLYLVHTPVPFKPNAQGDGPEMDSEKRFIPIDVPIIDTWRVVERYYKKGVFKAIGVSNFNAQQLQELYDKAEIKPMNLQVEFHVLWPQKDLLALCKKLGVVMTSYATIGSPGRGASPIPNDVLVSGDCMNQAAVQELAKKYNKTPAQILLRHTIQQGVCVIPKSTNRDRLKQNLNIFDFQLTTDDQKKLDEIEDRARLFTFNFARHHKNYPFEK